MSTPSTDRIEKKILLRAQRSRVWRALTDAREFGQWFGVEMQGSFAVGEHLLGKITTPGYDHLTMEVTVERTEEERLFSYRWHPYAIDPSADHSSEQTTLVELRLEEVPGGTELTVVESGFDALPAARRAEAYRMNDGGWAAQMENVRRHVAG